MTLRVINAVKILDIIELDAVINWGFECNDLLLDVKRFQVKKTKAAITAMNDANNRPYYVVYKSASKL